MHDNGFISFTIICNQIFFFYLFIGITKVPSESMISSLHSPFLRINKSSSILEENMLEHLEKNIFNNYLLACNI
jgi:hypothetical protein